MRFSDVLALPGVNEFCRLGSDIGLIAPHGSSLEDGTERIAREVADRTGASLYFVTYPGTWSEARELHVSGVNIGAGDSEALAAFTRRCRAAIAVHGFTRENLRHAALVGGRNETLSETVARLLRKHLPEPAEVVTGGDVPAGLRGRDPHNITNVFAEQGCQLELAPRLRVPYLSRIFWGGSTPNLNIYADAVIDALSEAVARYAVAA